jgi:DMSO/TMAO reductase YedYZ molybdopterin-dependent catalytic subunit
LKLSRRELLQAAFLAGSTLVLGDWQANPVLAKVSGGKQLGVLEFFQEGHPLMNAAQWSGLDGRLYTDLSTLTDDELITATEKFYIRTRCPDQIDLNTPWTIKINGLVENEVVVPIEAITGKCRDMGVHLMECSGNVGFNMHFGMLSACRWSGVPVTEIIDRAKVNPQATQLLVSGFDKHSQPSVRSRAGASWIFPLDAFGKLGAFFATEMNGTRLTNDHGFPVRMVIPGWYGCTCIKWVNEISFIDDTAPSTSQMREFASRTHQEGLPILARHFRPAVIDRAAMAVRVEQWLIDKQICYRVVGVIWGGEQPTQRLAIRFVCADAPDPPYNRVDHCQEQNSESWSLWSHMWRPQQPGVYGIQLKIEDPAVTTKRLDRGYYVRYVDIKEV